MGLTVGEEGTTSIFSLKEDGEDFSNIELYLFHEMDLEDSLMLTVRRVGEEDPSIYRIYGEHNKPTPAEIGAATTQYVDDAIEAAISDAIGGSY